VKPIVYANIGQQTAPAARGTAPPRFFAEAVDAAPRLERLRGDQMRTPDEVAATLRLKALGWGERRMAAEWDAIARRWTALSGDRWLGADPKPASRDALEPGDFVPERRAKSSRDTEQDQIGMVGDIIPGSGIAGDITRKRPPVRQHQDVGVNRTLILPGARGTTPKTAVLRPTRRAARISGRRAG
jgi:hypothetical protein